MVLLSAVPDQPAVQEARGGGMHLLAKPFDVDELVEAVRVAVAEHYGPQAA